MRVLFVDKGNRGRSQIAEAIFNKYTNHISKSAGIVASHAGEHVPENVVQIMKEEGINLSSKRVKKLTKNMTKTADKIFLLLSEEELKESPKYLRESSKIYIWKIKDPEHKGAEALRRTRNILKKKILKLE